MDIIKPDKDIALQYALDEMDYSNALLEKETSNSEINKVISYIDSVYNDPENHQIFSIDNKAILTLDILPDKKFVVIECCYTDPSARGKGYASALLQYAIKYWKDNYSNFRLILAVVKTNYNAINLYKSKGFVKRNTDNKFDYMEYINLYRGL